MSGPFPLVETGRILYLDRVIGESFDGLQLVVRLDIVEGIGDPISVGQGMPPLCTRQLSPHMGAAIR